MSFTRNCRNNHNCFKSLRADCGRWRASFLLPLKGSMTIEAALALPIFFFFMMNVIWLMETVRIESCMQAALTQVGEQIGEYSFYTQYASSSAIEQPRAEGVGSGDAASFLFTQTYVRSRLQAELKQSGVKLTDIQGGAAGISLLGSSIMENGGEVCLIASYRVKPFVAIPGLRGTKLKTRYTGHAWVGFIPGEWSPGGGGNEKDESAAYVTRRGSVYHTNPDCIYLNPQIRSVDASEVPGLRSGDGSIYYACHECHPALAGTVYITKEGTRYHSDVLCGGIRRDVRTVTVSDASSHYRLCSKCASGGKH